LLLRGKIVIFTRKNIQGIQLMEDFSLLTNLFSLFIDSGKSLVNNKNAILQTLKHARYVKILHDSNSSAEYC